MIYNSEFENIIKDIIENETVLKLKDCVQHCSSSRFDHCKNVAYYTYLFCKKYNLDYISGTRGAMLHDLYLYKSNSKENSLLSLHLFKHPKLALNNANKIFNLNDIEKDIIVKHMWPLTIILPKYKESYIVSFFDTCSAIVEFIEFISKYITFRTHINVR